MLVEVDSLDNDHGCFAGNSYFAEFLGLSERQVQRLIKSLKDKGYIAISYKYKPQSREIESRSIRVVQEKYPRFIPAPIAQEMAQTGGDKNVADNNTKRNNTKSNNINNKSATPKKVVAPPDLDDIFSPVLAEKVREWMEYKKERREGYKEIGLKSLITEIRHNAERYGETAVAELINTCMAAGYRGIIFDKLKNSHVQNGPAARQQEQAPKSTGNPFLDMLREEQAREAAGE